MSRCPLIHRTPTVQYVLVALLFEHFCAFLFYPRSYPRRPVPCRPDRRIDRSLPPQIQPLSMLSAGMLHLFDCGPALVVVTIGPHDQCRRRPTEISRHDLSHYSDEGGLTVTGCPKCPGVSTLNTHGTTTSRRNADGCLKKGLCTRIRRGPHFKPLSEER